MLRLYKDTVAKLIQFLDPTAGVFRTKRLGPVDSDDINRMAKKAWRKAGMTGKFNLTINRKLTTVTGRKADPQTQQIRPSKVWIPSKTARMHTVSFRTF